MTKTRSIGVVHDKGKMIKVVDEGPVLRKYKEGSEWMGQKILFDTHLFGKNYYWMQDGDGTIWLALMDEYGTPVLA